MIVATMAWTLWRHHDVFLRLRDAMIVSGKGRRTAGARAVARLLHGTGHHRPVLACGRYWPAVETLAELPYVRPVLSARNRVELSRLRERLRQPRPPYGVSVHRSLLDRDTVAELLRRRTTTGPGLS